MKLFFSQRPVKILVLLLLSLLSITAVYQGKVVSKKEAALVNVGDRTDTTITVPEEISPAGEKDLERQQEGDGLSLPPDVEEPQKEIESPAPIEKKAEIPAEKKAKNQKPAAGKAETGPEAKEEKQQAGTEAKSEPETGPEPDPDRPVGDRAREYMMLELINREREAAGVQALVMHEKLVQLARLRSAEMADLGCLYTDHISPAYGSPFEMMKNHGIKYTCAGENISYNTSVEKAHERLMLSEGHRRNLLNPKFSNVGIGIVQRDGRFYITQMFTD